MVIKVVSDQTLLQIPAVANHAIPAAAVAGQAKQAQTPCQEATQSVPVVEMVEMALSWTSPW